MFSVLFIHCFCSPALFITNILKRSGMSEESEQHMVRITDIIIYTCICVSNFVSPTIVSFDAQNWKQEGMSWLDFDYWFN